MEYRVLDGLCLAQGAQIEVVAVVANTVECLIERRQSLLTIENKASRLVAIEQRSTCKRPRPEPVIAVLHEEETSGWKLAEDGFEELLCRFRVPYEVTLEVR